MEDTLQVMSQGDINHLSYGVHVVLNTYVKIVGNVSSGWALQVRPCTQSLREREIAGCNEMTGKLAVCQLPVHYSEVS